MFESKYVKNITGNALRFPSKSDILIHCANCFCTMGSGIALQIKNIFPEAEEADNATESGDRNKLGTYTTAKVVRGEKTKFIVNLYGQYDMGVDERKANYEAIATGLELLYSRLSSASKKLRVVIPKKMASDRAGAEWDIIEQMINCFADKYEIETLIAELNE